MPSPASKGGKAQFIPPPTLSQPIFGLRAQSELGAARPNELPDRRPGGHSG